MAETGPRIKWDGPLPSPAEMKAMEVDMSLGMIPFIPDGKISNDFYLLLLLTLKKSQKVLNLMLI